MLRLIGFSACLLVLVGCAANQPVLYPNSHLQTVGPYRADQDIEQCKAMASQYVNSYPGREVARQTAWGAAGGAAIGAVGGAISGNAGQGAALGAATGATAGLMHGAYQASEASPVWQNFVAQCLRDKGYQVIGWQ
jgi:outer membrane lipoprotein SlyB